MEHIQKILLRITALVLAAVLTAGLLPSASAERFTSEVDTREYNMEGQSILGSMIVNDLNEAQQSDTGDSLYDVTDLVIDGSTATVEFYAEEDAELVVALYTEDGAQLLTSAKTDVTADMTQATLTFDGEMPQYFTAAAYLLDSYDFSPLCAPYESIRYTREIQELLASDIHDYDPELVLNLDESERTNFVVYDETTIRITEQEGVNLVTFADYDNLIYVIENADEQFTSLTEGDVFAYVYGEDQQLLMAKVAGIDIDGTTVTIQGGELELEDVFSHVKLQAVSDPDTMTVDESTGAEGVVYLGRGGTAGDCGPQAVGSFFKSFEFELPHIQTGDYDFSGKLGLDLEVEMEVLIEGTSRFVRFDMSYTSTLTFEMDLTGDDAKLEIPINKILVPIIPRLVDVGISPNLVLRFNASISGTISSSASVGMQISQKGWGLPKIKERCKKPSGELSFQVEGTVFFGLELEPEIVLACGAGELNLGFEGGFVAEGTLVKISDEDTGLHHDCVGCVTGECSIKIGMTAEGRLGWFDVETTLAGKKFPLPKLDFYLCLYHGERGFGECPHMLRRITVKVRDAQGDPVQGASVHSYHENLYISDDYTNEEGVAEIYLPKGKHEVTVRKDGLTEVKSVNANKPKKLNVSLKLNVPEQGSDGEDQEGPFNGSDNNDYADYGKLAYSGSCGDNLTWEFYEGGTLFIEGKGSMYDYDYMDRAPWYAHAAKIDTIEIARGVTSIGELAFHGLSNVTTANLADTIVSIGSRAFDGCKHLTDITIPDGVTVIRECTFEECPRLETLELGTGLKRIETGAFGDVYSSYEIPEIAIYVDTLKQWLSLEIEDVTASPSCGRYVALVPDDALLPDLTIPDGITEIREYAFHNVKNISYFEIPDHVTTIGARAFEFCEFDGISFGRGLTYVGEDAFYRYGNSIDVVETPSLKDWLEIEFANGCANPLHYGDGGLNTYRSPELYINGIFADRIVIPDGTVLTNPRSFVSYDKLVSLTFPSDLKKIPNSFLAGCCNLEAVEIPAGVTVIGNAAFSGCESLTELIIPGNVTSIGNGAFSDCYGLTSMTIPSNVTEIGNSLFYNCAYLESVTIPYHMTRIPNGMFSDCVSLKNVTIPDRVTSIGQSAFASCASLESIEIPQGVTAIGSDTNF